MRRLLPFLAFLPMLAAAQTPVDGAAAQEGKPPAPAVALYLERCGGCHGVQGISAPEVVPTLRNLVGYFLCSREGREYIVRLPSIATIPVEDALLTDLVNFVVFDLGGGDDRRFPRYTETEVGQLRARPLTTGALTAHREAIVLALRRNCAAPSALSRYRGPQTQPVSAE